MNLIDVSRELRTDEECYAFLEKMRWNDGVVRCTTCGCNRISRITRKVSATSKNKRAQLYQCLEKTCKQQFSVTSGTIFHDSRVPLSKWFMAISLIMDAKKGLSSKQLQQHLGLGSYQTAWHMTHRIREAMQPEYTSKLSGIVEMDETYLGGVQRGHQHKPGHPMCKKEIVIGIKQRGGDTRFFHVAHANIATLTELIRENVSEDVELVMTDEYTSYPPAMRALALTGKHKTIRHKSKVYVRGIVHTNSIESAFSLLKRGLIGSFHWVSIKHLHRYLNEFEHRFNNRKTADRFSEMVMLTAQTSPLPYQRLIAEPTQAA
jgi:transposase-like protein